MIVEFIKSFIDKEKPEVNKITPAQYLTYHKITDSGIYAACVAASYIPRTGQEIYTVETYAPKFLDAECEKHRMICRNSSSSRAIPFGTRQIIYIPKDVRTHQKGMQSMYGVDFETYDEFVAVLKELHEHVYNKLLPFKDRVHKQHLNRYLEPWTMQRKVWTATHWNNFFNLRLAEDVQPDMRELAQCMSMAIDAAEPAPLADDEWHLPYALPELEGEAAIISSVAGCARVSHDNLDLTSRTLEKDQALYAKLLSSKHMTPFEHQAKPMAPPAISYLSGYSRNGVTHMDGERHFYSGAFKGFIQYRQLLETWNDDTARQ